MPLLDLRVLSHRTYAVGVTVQAVSFLAMMGAMILLPLYLQDLRGLSPLQTGLLVAPGGLAMGLLGPRVGKAFDRFGARPLVIPGSIGVVVGPRRCSARSPPPRRTPSCWAPTCC